MGKYSKFNDFAWKKQLLIPSKNTRLPIEFSFDLSLHSQKVDQVCTEYMKQYELGINKSYAYLQWRYLNHPFSQNYYFFSLKAPDNELVGIGFAAQGFKKATHYQRSEASWNSRAAWIFEGVQEDLIGTSGLGGGAAGQEIDRYDTALGSPQHAVVLASATAFGPDMIRTKEEFEAAVNAPCPDPLVRADIVFYETPGGGAVGSE